MKERPIIMTAESVRAILAGRKTQTRRVIVPQPDGVSNDGRPYVYKTITVVREKSLEAITHPDGHPEQRFINVLKSPYGVPGDRLWVRETWNYLTDKMHPGYIYRANNESLWLTAKWRSPIHMPRWASRLTLEITGVRVERVQEISEADARAEGITTECPTAAHVISWSYQRAYAALWDNLNGKRGYPWASNPWVWVVEFRRTE